MAKNKEPRPLTRTDKKAVDDLEATYPKTRADCPAAGTPCPYVMCRYHLWVHKLVKDNKVVRVTETSAFGDETCTCALNIVDENPDGLTAIQLAERLGWTRQRIQQIESKAVKKAKVNHKEELAKMHSVLQDLED